MGLEVYWLKGIRQVKGSDRRSSADPDPVKLAEENWRPLPERNLTGRERRELNRKAQSLRPCVQIGNRGVTREVIGEIRRQLLIHELIKVKWATLSKEDGDKREQAEELAQKVGAHLISLIGKTLVLYRQKEQANQ
ncbi:YhbY family RNA-binding protein [Thermodesulforhabdus norvegica]|uniref:Putative RNA-binding protein, YhbY family n=1 Tax=Thermodesulforhabdus norvegica TaxID=39841 RepID=A0A1I4T915_9BACT|nr:YhbY family RNA-binding protein [Thermodesulforhabdus norvegica]SFM73083.1 putative RNA-binding protein, YhbY family [Thermodesulforhabdus norvegica]